MFFCKKNLPSRKTIYMKNISEMSFNVIFPGYFQTNFNKWGFIRHPKKESEEGLCVQTRIRKIHSTSTKGR